MTDQPLPHPPLPGPGALGPDPEPLGTERFERLMRRAFTPRGRPVAVLEAHRKPVDGRGECRRRPEAA